MPSQRDVTNSLGSSKDCIYAAPAVRRAMLRAIRLWVAVTVGFFVGTGVLSPCAVCSFSPCASARYKNGRPVLQLRISVLRLGLSVATSRITVVPKAPITRTRHKPIRRFGIAVLQAAVLARDCLPGSVQYRWYHQGRKFKGWQRALVTENESNSAVCLPRLLQLAGRQYVPRYADL